jgi:hypothetical protein
MWLIQKSGSTRISQSGAGMGKAASCWRGAYSAHLVEGRILPVNIPGRKAGFTASRLTCRHHRLPDLAATPLRSFGVPDRSRSVTLLSSSRGKGAFGRTLSGNSGGGHSTPILSPFPTRRARPGNGKPSSFWLVGEGRVRSMLRWGAAHLSMTAAGSLFRGVWLKAVGSTRLPASLFERGKAPFQRSVLL